VFSTTAIDCEPPLLCSFNCAQFVSDDVPFPDTWGSRLLYTGSDGADNWAGVVEEPGYALADSDAFNLGRHRSRALESFGDHPPGSIVSLGPGDGKSDIPLIRSISTTTPPVFIPVDISLGLLTRCVLNLKSCANIPVAALCDFEADFELIRTATSRFATPPILWGMLGGTIGNLDGGERDFLRQIREVMNDEDALLLDIPIRGPTWTAEMEPRLSWDSYTACFRRFLAGGLARLRADNTTELQGAIEHELQLSLFSPDDGLNKKTVRITDTRTSRTLLEFRRYDWHRFCEWTESIGFRCSFDAYSLDQAERFGMGVALLQRS
jgi:histidine-specific SAM-dependent methyltransferase